MQEVMMRSMHPVFEDADLFIILVDLATDEGVELFWDKIKNNPAKKIVVLNKSDLAKPEKIEALENEWKSKPEIAEVITVSALKNQNIDSLLQKIIGYMPEHFPYFDKEDISDRPVRFFVSEIIREKIFFQFKEEIPYSCDVHTESYKDEPEIAKITAIITVDRDTQKGIILGEKGKSIKALGIKSREDIELFVGKKVFLELIVKVEKDWRNNERFLKRRGYIES